MLRTARSPARQLGSVCVRFQNPLARLAESAWNAPRGFWTRAGERESEASGASPVERLRRLEAVLMLAREPLSSRKLSQFAGLADGTQARTLVKRLNTVYDELGRAFRVEEVAGGFQLLTRPKFAPWLRRLGHVPPEIRLSSPAMETLAVVAYRQPVLRADIEAIRGVNCGEILRQLMERDLVRIGGRSEELGRPYLYATTRRFLQVFGMRDVADLPRAELMRDALAQPTASAEDQHEDSMDNNDPQPRQTEGGV